MSLRASTPWPSACSGEKYAAVPITAPVWVRLSSVFMARAMPKSVTLTPPSAMISTLPGFTSRWTTPWRWANESAAATLAPMLATSWAGRDPDSRRTAERARPSMNSMTMK